MNLLIVDDEKATRETLCNKIDWHGIGITNIQTAKNGIEALSISDNSPPNIMLCDVKMPKMNGIQLGQCIRSRFPECKLIYISGYCDKEYLKSAIELQVVSYIEKPISLEEVERIVSKTVANIFLEQSKKTSEKNMHEHFNQNNLTIRQNLAKKIMQSSRSESYNKSLETLFSIESSVCNQELFAPFIITLNYKYETTETNKQSISTMVSNSICEEFKPEVPPISVLNNTTSDFVCYLENSTQLVTLSYFHPQTDTSPINLLQIGNKLSSFCIQQSEAIYKVTISLGSAYTVSAYKLPETCVTAQQTSKSTFYNETSTILIAQDLPPTYYYEFNIKILEMFHNLLYQQKDDAIVFIQNVTKDIYSSQDMRLTFIRNIYERLLSVIIDIVNENKTLSKSQENELWEKIRHLTSLFSLERFIISIINEYFENIVISKNTRINDIMNYIYCNYANCNLSVTDISNAMFLSKAYVCAIFKKATNKTLNEFITEVRIEKSKQLLKQDYKFYEIAEAVGISDPNYFSTLFKKYTSLTPSEFRERQTP